MNRRLHRRTDRAVARNLAEGADGAEFRSGVQIRATMVPDLADPGILVVVVDDFNGIEMNLTGEQHAHDQGMHPDRVPVFSPVSHLGYIALSWLGLNLAV